MVASTQGERDLGLVEGVLGGGSIQPDHVWLGKESNIRKLRGSSQEGGWRVQGSSRSPGWLV